MKRSNKHELLYIKSESKIVHVTVIQFNSFCRINLHDTDSAIGEGRKRRNVCSFETVDNEKILLFLL